MRARDIMTRGVVTIADTATVYEAAELMVSTRVSGLPVVDAEANLIGITTFMLKDAQNLNFAIAAEEYAK